MNRIEKYLTKNSNYTRRECCLLLSSLYLFISCIALLILYYLHTTITVPLEKPVLITFPHLRKSVNETLDPCEDFYQFVCDGFIKGETIVNGYRCNQYTVVEEKLDSELISILEDEVLIEGAFNQKISQMRLFYDTCMVDGNGREGIRKTLKIIEDMKEKTAKTFNTKNHKRILRNLGDLMNVDLRDSILSNEFPEQQRTITMKKMLAKLIQVENNHTFNYQKLRDEPNLNIRMRPLIFDMIPPVASISEEMSRQLTWIINLVFEDDQAIASQGKIPPVIAGRKKSRKGNYLLIKRKVMSLVKTQFAIFREFASILKIHSENTSQWNVLTVESLQKMWDQQVGLSDLQLPSVEWVGFLQKITPNIGSNVMTKDTVITVIGDPRWIPKLGSLVYTLPFYQVEDYAEWGILVENMEKLGNRYSKLFKNLDPKTNFKHDFRNVSRAIECKNTVVKYFPHYLDRLYIQKFGDQEVLADIVQMYEKIYSEFQHMLHMNDWLDDKERALQKLSKMSSVFGYFDFVFDDEVLDFIYKNYHLRKGMDFKRMKESLSNVSLFDWNNPDVKLFYSEAHEVNAWFFDRKNLLFMPMAQLNEPYYSAKYSMSMNFGSIGWLIAHEIMHGLDIARSRYDDEGKKTNWWAHETRERFKNKTQCFVHQYNHFMVPVNDSYNIPVNGEFTQIENIPDNVGIKAAYLAMKYFVEESERKLYRIRGLKGIYTDEQLFFLHGAYSKCEKSTEVAVMRENKRDNHAPYRARVNVVLQNFPEFAKAFKCPVNSRMNPLDKCTIW